MDADRKSYRGKLKEAILRAHKALEKQDLSALAAAMDESVEIRDDTIKELEAEIDLFAEAYRQVCGALWNCDPQGDNWTHISRKYLAYASGRIASSKGATTEAEHPLEPKCDKESIRKSMELMNPPKPIVDPIQSIVGAFNGYPVMNDPFDNGVVWVKVPRDFINKIGGK